MQKSKGRHRKTKITWLTAALIVWMCMATILMNKVFNDSYVPFSIKSVGTVTNDTNVGVVITQSKSWINDEGSENETIGAQFDGVISNHFDGDVINWKLTIKMPPNAYIDSNWNMDYYVDQEQMIITPNQYIATIPGQSTKTFGFVMVSDEKQVFRDFEITGYRRLNMFQFPMFWILLVAFLIWVIAFVAQVTAEIRLKHLKERKAQDEAIISQTMRMFVEMIDAKDPYTKGHSVRVAAYSREIGRRMNLDEEDIKKLGYVAMLHDCGKMGMPDRVLKNPNILPPEEREIIREHTTIGGRMLEKFTAIEGVKEGALYHHERFDGTGYPEGLKGKEIPFFARIICVADSFDTMNSDRCYRNHLPMDVILRELEENKGTQFDPEIVEYMIDMIKDGFVKQTEQ